MIQVWGSSHVARAKFIDVAKSIKEGKPAIWKKYYNGKFSEPALGGESSPLEEGNPRTRSMDVSYITAVEKYIMVVATTVPGSEETTAELHATWSDDGIRWAKRVPLANDGGEMFFPSIVGIEDGARQTGEAFYIYYTFSKAGAWDRWSDAVIARRRVEVRSAEVEGR